MVKMTFAEFRCALAEAVRPECASLADALADTDDEGASVAAASLDEAYQLLTDDDLYREELHDTLLLAAINHFDPWNHAPGATPRDRPKIGWADMASERFFVALRAGK